MSTRAARPTCSTGLGPWGKCASQARQARISASSNCSRRTDAREEEDDIGKAQ
jgi:hypothetical protein